MDQIQIDAICILAAQRFPEILDYVGVKYRTYRNGSIYCKCPIHGGDNPTAFRFYPNPNGYASWKCSTQHCHEKHGGGIIGFMQGMTHAKTGRYVPNEVAAKWLAQLLNINIDKLDAQSLASAQERQNYIRRSQLFKKKDEVKRWTVEEIRCKHQIPSKEFLKRGYSADILTRMCIGDYGNRTIVPVFDDDPNFIVGFTARTTYPKCGKCGLYHEEESCEKGEPKWKHSAGFTTTDYLYNYSELLMGNHKTATIVESPGNALRLMDAGYLPVVCIFGSYLSLKQRYLLSAAGVQKIHVLMDGDEAGEKGARHIYDMCHGLFFVNTLDIKEVGAYNDVGEIREGGLLNKIVSFLNK